MIEQSKVITRLRADHDTSGTDDALARPRVGDRVIERGRARVVSSVDWITGDVLVSWDHTGPGRWLRPGELLSVKAVERIKKYLQESQPSLFA